MHEQYYTKFPIDGSACGKATKLEGKAVSNEDIANSEQRMKSLMLADKELEQKSMLENSQTDSKSSKRSLRATRIMMEHDRIRSPNLLLGDINGEEEVYSPLIQLSLCSLFNWPTMSHIPEDVLADKLSRLPAKSLLRFISKPWCALIGSQGFIKLHLTRATKTNTNCSIINGQGGYLYAVKLDSLNNSIRVDPSLSHK
ncbi:hypothetical protein LguiA_013168 [Lonicera macranthoides]